jgi:hypothetical protein
MDIDLIAKHMPGLIEFKRRIEAMLDAADAGSGSTSELLSNQVANLRKTLSGIAEEVAALQVLRSGDDKRLTDISGLIDGLAGLKDMAEWFAANHAGLDVLLSIGDDLAPTALSHDEPLPQPDPVPAPAPAEPTAAPSTAPDPAAATEQPVT